MSANPKMHLDSWESPDTSQTYAWGVRLGMLLRPGDLLCLYGDLGAGKTLVAQGIGQALRTAEPVTSPTFTMIQQYNTHQENTGSLPEDRETSSVTLVHMDLYRLQNPIETDIIGIWDFFQANNIILIEWPEIISGQLPADRYELHISGSGEDSRAMTLSFFGKTAEHWHKWLEIRQ